MCFFKAPSVSAPAVTQVAEQRPTITETKAPEPDAVSFGSSATEQTGSTTETTGTSRGISSVKIKLDTPKAPIVADTTGANRGLNTVR